MEITDPVLRLEERINLLELEREAFLKQDRYSDADIAAKDLANLRIKLKQKQLELLKNSHLNEREILEKNFSDESSAFNRTWDSLLEAYLTKCDSEIQEFNKKHKEDYSIERKKLEGTLHMFFKPSSALLNMMKCKEKAVKAGKYADAQILHDQIEEARIFEESRFADQKRSAVDQGLVNFEQGYEKKMQSLKKRHQTGMNELEIQRLAEFDVLAKKYDNLRREMENTQQIMRNIQEGKHTTAAGRHHQSPNKTLYSTSSSLNPISTNRNNPEN